MTRKRLARLAASIAIASLVLGLGAGSAMAGEITGNGKLKDVHGRSICAFSGQEDLQWWEDDLNTIPKDEPTKGDPGHAQSWGQIPHEVRVFLTSIGENPGVACNPVK